METHGRLNRIGEKMAEQNKTATGSFSAAFNLLSGVDRNGHPVERTKLTHPYSYEAFVQWRGGKNSEATDTIYSDRLLQWDFDKHDRLCMKHFGNKGQYWADREPGKIEKFLRDWTDNQSLKLILVEEHCNQASGYPLWRFDFAT